MFEFSELPIIPACTSHAQKDQWVVRRYFQASANLASGGVGRPRNGRYSDSTRNRIAHRHGLDSKVCTRECHRHCPAVVKKPRWGTGIVGVDPIPREVFDQHGRKIEVVRNHQPERRNVRNHEVTAKLPQAFTKSLDHREILEWGAVKTLNRRIEVLDQRRNLYQTDITREAMVCEAPRERFGKKPPWNLGEEIKTHRRPSAQKRIHHRAASGSVAEAMRRDEIGDASHSSPVYVVRFRL
jgi:hypothetical protein